MNKLFIMLVVMLLSLSAPAKADIYSSSLPVIQQTTEGSVYGNVVVYMYVGPDLAFAANRYHFILGSVNEAVPPLVVRILYLGVKPSSTASNSSFGSYWTLRKRKDPTLVPGALSELYYAFDSVDTPPTTNIQIGANPGTSPTGGQLYVYDDQLIIDGEEPTGGTLNLPGMALSRPFGARALYRWQDTFPGKPIVLRSSEYLELQQGGTAGTGNVSIICLFTIETAL